MNEPESSATESELGAEVDEPTPQPERNVWLGITLPLFLVTLYTLLISTFGSYLIEWVEEWDSWLLSMAFTAGLFTPVTVALAFSLSIPLLLFRSILHRTVAGVLSPAMIWIAVFVGTYFERALSTSFHRPQDLGWYLETTSILLIALASGFIVVGWAIWFLRWRLEIPQSLSGKPRTGIQDLIAVTTFGAAFFAYELNFMPSGLPLTQLILITGFYGLLGVFVFLITLLAIRLLLGPERQPLRGTRLLGVAVTFAFSICLWIIPMVADGAPTTVHPIPAAFLMGTVMWGVAACTAWAICSWLRRYDLQLMTSKLDRIENANQHSDS